VQGYHANLDVIPPDKTSSLCLGKITEKTERQRREPAFHGIIAQVLLNARICHILSATYGRVDISNIMKMVYTNK
jgi:hypothetical protein